MDLYNSISRRKACRDYIQDPLESAELEAMRQAIEGFDSLYSDTPLDYRIISETKGMLRVKAPHFLIISGQGKEGELESAGFLFQQLVLWLDSHDIGSVWLGKTKDAQQNLEGKDIIALAFGKSGSSVHRSPTEFRRKPISEITNNPENDCIKAVHFAPSGMNLQPWYLEDQGDKVVLYKRKPKPPLSLAYKSTDVDMGIALCHYAVACKHFDKPFSFKRKDGESSKKGLELFGEINWGAIHESCNRKP